MTKKEKIRILCTAIVLICVFLLIGVCGACERGNIGDGACFAAVTLLAATAFLLQKAAEVLTETPEKTQKERAARATNTKRPKTNINNNTIIARKTHEINTKNTF